MKSVNLSLVATLLVLFSAGPAHAGSLALTGNSCKSYANATYDGTSPSIVGYSGVVVCPMELYELSTDIVATVNMMVQEYSSTASLKCNLTVHNSSGGFVVSIPKETSVAGTGASTLQWTSVSVQRGGYVFADCTFPKDGSIKPQVRFIKLTY